MASSLTTSKQPGDSVYLDGLPTLPDIDPKPAASLPDGPTAAETWIGTERAPESFAETDRLASSAETLPVASSVATLPLGTSAAALVDPLCPKCHWRLIDPATMGYCPKCGYCRYIEVERRSSMNIDLDRRPPSGLGLRSVIDVVAGLPGWLSMLLGGSFAILLYAKAIDHLLPEGSSDRSMFGFTMLMAAVLVGGLAHLWALLKVAPSYVDVSPVDIFSPGLIWGSALRRLPETRWQVWLAGWSLTIMFASWFFIAG